MRSLPQLAVWALMTLAPGRLPGQTAATHTFEVASVKPVPGDSPYTDAAPRRSGTRVFMHNAELASMVAWAFDLRNPGYQLIPGTWEKALWESYDVDAVAPESADDHELRLLFQALLRERFQLRVHSEKRRMPALDLVIARGGAHLHPARAGRRQTIGYGGLPTWVEIEETHQKLVGVGASMGELAMVLTRQLRTPVQDQTGLTGLFDYGLEFSRSTDASEHPFLTTAIKSLGLELKKSTGNFVVLVVDSVSKVTGN